MNIIGTWALVRATGTDGEGRDLPNPYGDDKAMGRVTFNADGRMMAVLCDGRPIMPEGETREYSSYIGNYTFDGKQLVTRVDGASIPARMGTDQVRQVSFEGDLMVLRPPFQPYQGIPQQRALYWRKIADD